MWEQIDASHTVLAEEPCQRIEEKEMEEPHVLFCVALNCSECAENSDARRPPHATVQSVRCYGKWQDDAAAKCAMTFIQGSVGGVSRQWGKLRAELQPLRFALCIVVVFFCNKIEVSIYSERIA